MSISAISSKTALDEFVDKLPPKVVWYDVLEDLAICIGLVILDTLEVLLHLYA